VTIYVVLRPAEGNHRDTALSWAAPNNQRLLVHASFEEEIILQLGSPPAASVEVLQPPGWEGVWHVLQLQRAQQQGEIRVDGMRLTSGESFGGFGAVEQSADLFIGGDRFSNKFCATWPRSSCTGAHFQMRNAARCRTIFTRNGRCPVPHVTRSVGNG